MDKLSNEQLIELISMSRRYASIYNTFSGFISISANTQSKPQIQLTEECFKSLFSEYIRDKIDKHYNQLSHDVYGVNFITLERVR